MQGQYFYNFVDEVAPAVAASFRRISFALDFVGLIVVTADIVLAKVVAAVVDPPSAHAVDPDTVVEQIAKHQRRSVVASDAVEVVLVVHLPILPPLVDLFYLQTLPADGPDNVLEYVEVAFVLPVQAVVMTQTAAAVVDIAAAASAPSRSTPPSHRPPPNDSTAHT